MGVQLLRHDRLIDGPEVDAFLFVEYCIDIQVIKRQCQKPDIIEVKFEQVFLLRLPQREMRVADGSHVNRYARGRQIIKLFAVIVVIFAFLVFNLIEDDALLLVFKVAWNEIVYSANLQPALLVIL